MHPRVKVQVYTREKEPERKFFEMVGDGDEISKKHVGKNWEASIRWEFDYSNRLVRDGESVIFKEIPNQSEEIIPPKRADLSLDLVSNIFSSAASAQSKGNSDNTIDSAMLVRNLTDADPRVQRNARDALISLGSAAVAPMLEAWHRNPADYAMKLGVVMVINNILRNNAQIASTFSERLTDDDIHMLVEALSDVDKTVRLQATELLYYLKDKRVVSNSLSAISNNNNEDGVYNNVLILKEIIPSLDEAERRRTRGEIMRLVPGNYINTRALAIKVDP